CFLLSPVSSSFPLLASVSCLLSAHTVQKPGGSRQHTEVRADANRSSATPARSPVFCLLSPDFCSCENRLRIRIQHPPHLVYRFPQRLRVRITQVLRENQ